MEKTITPMSFPELPYYLKINMITEDDIVSVMAQSSIHVNKESRVATQYFVDFVRDKPNQFRDEVLQAIVNMYGLRLEHPKYS